MESPINWNLVLHPLNWITIFLMVFIAMIFAHFVLSYFATGSGSGGGIKTMTS